MRWYLLMSEVLSRIFQRKIFVVLPWTQLTPICVFSHCSSVACCNESNTPTFRILPVTFYLCFPRGTGALKRVSYLYWRMLALIIVSYVSVKFVSLGNWICSLFPTWLSTVRWCGSFLWWKFRVGVRGVTSNPCFDVFHLTVTSHRRKIWPYTFNLYLIT